MSIDEIRNQFEDDDFTFDEEEIWQKPVDTERIILGMTPVQRFVIAVLLFLTVMILSTFCLLVAGKIGFPV
ncbi:MAG: hypothetical protein U5K99_04480 [Anaerolineales bacterium]|nr:hypothetical protein [Anaerolineales bacterium]